jgi:hypothetical protein
MTAWPIWPMWWGGIVAGALLFPLLRYRSVRLFECIRTEAPEPPNMLS